MPFVYLNADQLFLGTEEVILGEDPTPQPAVGFELYRNGVLQDILWSSSQLLSMSLAIMAYDGEIGTGQLTVPSTTWQIGDRVSFVDPDSGKVLYTGYLMRPQYGRNPDSITEMQTTWQLMDINRQFIGRRVEDVTENGPFLMDVLTNHMKDLIEGAGSPNPTVDILTWVDSSAVAFPTTTYNSDGATDWIAQIIQFTGKTVYLGYTDTENALELHVHDLTTGPTSDIAISDDPGAAVGDVFAPSLNATLTLETADLKDGVTGRNGVTSVPSGVAGTYGNGGLGWEATIDYGGVDEDNLVLMTNNVILLGSLPKPTFSCVIYHLTGTQVAGIRAGSIVNVSWPMAALMTIKRVSSVTLTVSRDAGGNPLKGYWDLSLEIAFPLRGPTAFTGFGGQGSQLGALSTFTYWDHTTVFESDPAIDVGEFETALAQLQDQFGGAVTVPDVSLTWSVVKDDIDTPHPDYSILDNPTVTDSVGQSIVVIERTGSSDDSKHRVKAIPT